MPHLLKEGLRQDFRVRRANLGDTNRAEASRRICATIIALHQYKNAANVALYWPMAEEIDIRPVIADMLGSGRKVFLPRVIKKPRQLEFCPYTGDPDSLAPGPFGLREPRTAPVEVDTIGVVFVPGLAFDLHGHRLGYGTGFYDRFLKTTQATRIGVAFDIQTIDILPIAEHDVAMNLIVTETRTF